MTTSLYLLRHGDTAANGRLIGSTDRPVAESGFHQLAATRRALAGKPFTRILTSPMKRCRQTVGFLELDCEVAVLDELREIDFGDWEGLTFQEISHGWPKKVQEWSSWSEDFAFPGGERIGDFLARIHVARRRIEQCADHHLLVVAHGGVIRHLLCSFLGLPADKYLLFNIQPGCFTTIELFSEGGVLTSLNSCNIE